MSKSLPLDDMSIEEKLQTMESIWDDLVTHAGNIVSPEWHRDVLAEREKGISKGSENSIDWAAAKEKIKNDLK